VIGSVGGTRSGGSASSDSFNKREKAAEDMVRLVPWGWCWWQYMKQREAEKLKALRKMLEEQREHIDEIEKHINKLEDETNGKK
jgi:ATPase inhibitor, mitochondrial